MDKLTVTKLGTIHDNSGFEMLLEDFLVEMEKNISSRNYNVVYDKNEKYIVTYKGKKYLLEFIGKEENNIFDDTYNKTISRLKKICNIKLGIYNEEEEKRKEKERIKKIVIDGENGIFADKEAMTTYLSYLKKQKILGNAIHFIKNDWPDFLSIFGIILAFTGIMFLIGMFLALQLGKGIFMLIGALTGFSIVPVWSICKIIKKYIPKKKIHRQKIKKMKILLKKSNIIVETKSNVRTNDTTKICEDNTTKSSNEFKDIIYKKASILLDKIDGLSNENEKERFKKEIKEVLLDYSNGLKLEGNIGNLELSVSGCNDINELQSRTRNGLVKRLDERLGKINESVEEISAKEISLVELERERLLIEERLEPVVIDSEVIDGTLREREENKVPVRVRKKELSRAKVTY